MLDKFQLGNRLRTSIIIFCVLILSGCAVVHHVQVGDIDDRNNSEQFEILVSETGINLVGVAHLAALASRNHASRDKYGKLADYIKIFQMGPSTGLGVFDEKYAEKLLALILHKCPSGKVSGITSIREMSKYPFVSGEIVKVVGYCQKN